MDRRGYPCYQAERNLFIFGSYHCIFTIGFILQSVYNRRIISQIVWFKPNAQPNITCRMFTESTEFVVWSVNETPDKAKNWTFNYDDMKGINEGKQMRNLWAIPLTKRSERINGKHPSQKPLELIERIVLASTKDGDRILDPFRGRGRRLSLPRCTDVGGWRSKRMRITTRSPKPGSPN